MRFWSLHRHHDKPDLEQAEADLERIRDNRSRVDDLVDDLRREKRLNNFTANVTVTFRGGRP
jgi:hypothetical protein